MKIPVSCTALGLALVAGAPLAHAQTVITRQIVDPPLVTVPAAETVQTTETVRTIRTAPVHTTRHRVVTTRTITRRIVPVAPAAIAPAPVRVATAPAVAPGPLYDEVVPDTVAAAPGPLYDTTVPPAPLASPLVPATPVVQNEAVIGTQPYTYRYVYEPGRILVVDPATGIAVQSIPR